MRSKIGIMIRSPIRDAASATAEARVPESPLMKSPSMPPTAPAEMVTGGDMPFRTHSCSAALLWFLSVARL
ncbi:MAG: hypothetical protein COZ05_17805, partial [Armatimonadetes bacterium CG_4_10_14_3_um_filter_59_10]